MSTKSMMRTSVLLAELEGENAKLNKRLAEDHLDMHASKEHFQGEALAPQVKGA